MRYCASRQRRPVVLGILMWFHPHSGSSVPATATDDSRASRLKQLCIAEFQNVLMKAPGSARRFSFPEFRLEMRAANGFRPAPDPPGSR